MNLLMFALILAIGFPTFSQPQTLYWNPFNITTASLEDSFRDCEMDTETIDLISISDSQGLVTTIDVAIVLETEVVTTVDISEVEVWYELLPSETVLTGIGLIMYEEDTVANRDSFFIFLNESQDKQQWWFALFRENIFTAPQGELESWILQEENFCGLFEVSLATESADS